jgi:hypothetical protein
MLGRHCFNDPPIWDAGNSISAPRALTQFFYTTHRACFHEKMMRDPMRGYHIEHGLGSIESGAGYGPLMSVIGEELG